MCPLWVALFPWQGILNSFRERELSTCGYSLSHCSLLDVVRLAASSFSLSDFSAMVDCNLEL